MNEPVIHTLRPLEENDKEEEEDEDDDKSSTAESKDSSEKIVTEKEGKTNQTLLQRIIASSKAPETSSATVDSEASKKIGN